MHARRYVDLYAQRYPEGTVVLVGKPEHIFSVRSDISDATKLPIVEFPREPGWNAQKYGNHLLQATAGMAERNLVLICGPVHSGFSFEHNSTTPLKLRGDIVVTVEGRVIYTSANPAMRSMTQPEIMAFANRFLTQPERGDYMEFGVFDGRSLTLAYHVFKDRLKRFLAFDSFEGILGAREEEQWFDGTFVSNQETLRFNMEAAGCDMSRFESVKCNFVDGLTPDLYEKHDLKLCSVAHIDCDVYLPAKRALTFLTPLLRQGSVLLFDDFNGNAASNATGERRALREWLAENPHIEVEKLYDYSVIGCSFVVHVNETAATAEAGRSR